MKKSDVLFFTGLLGLTVGIILVVLFKFVIKTGDTFAILNFRDINVMEFNGNNGELKNFLSKDETTYCLIFDLNDCYSCINRGLEELKTLKSQGSACLGIVIHDFIEEVRGWAANYEFSPFLMLKRGDFYKHVKTPYTPVLVIFEGEKVGSYRFITNN